MDREVAGIVQAWRKGDTAALEQDLKQEYGEDPAFYERLVVARNRKWLPHIVTWANQDQDYLVVVGAMHLVGAQGIVNLLRERGYQVQQL